MNITDSTTLSPSYLFYLLLPTPLPHLFLPCAGHHPPTGVGEGGVDGEEENSSKARRASKLLG